MGLSEVVAVSPGVVVEGLWSGASVVSVVTVGAAAVVVGSAPETVVADPASSSPVEQAETSRANVAKMTMVRRTVRQVKRGPVTET